MDASNTTFAGLTALGGFASYLVLARSLRYRRRDKLSRDLGYDGLTEEEIYKKITLDDAQTISHALESQEFPFLNNMSLQFALFRTYAIPTISKVLKGTRQLSDTVHSGRRYADTVVLIAEFSANALDSERGSMAIARMNHLHSLYPAIKPADTLYTLSLFITQPAVFFDRYEWRKTTPLERAAMHKFWVEVGIRMKIPPEDIPPTFDAMMEWAEEYEKKYMVPADSNQFVAEKTVELLLYYVPTAPGRWLGRQLVLALLDERLRVAMKMEPAKWWAKAIVFSALKMRALVLRYLALPRQKPRRRVSREKDPKTGKYHMLTYDNEPWYVPTGFWQKYGPMALFYRLGGWPVPGADGFASDGYNIIEVGPKRLEQSGHKSILEEAEQIRAMGGYQRMGGCPFG